MKGVYNMRGRFVGGLTAGLLLGAAASMLMMPQMNYRTKRRVNKTSRRIAHGAGDIVHRIMDFAR